MGVVGCYTMDLYCDAAGCSRNTSIGDAVIQTESSARRHARKVGWYISGDKVLCPPHNQLRLNSAKGKELRREYKDCQYGCSAENDYCDHARTMR